MKFDLFPIIMALALIFIIFSPFLSSRTGRGNSEGIGWFGLFASKWFGVPFIFLLLFGNYTDPSLQRLFLNIIISAVLSFLVSLVANRKRFFNR